MALILLGGSLCAQAAELNHTPSVAQAFDRMYRFDFDGAHSIVDRLIAHDPEDPLPHTVEAAAYFFSELDRLKILQIEFFEDNRQVTSARKLSPDPALRERFFSAIDLARDRARARLTAQAHDREALFALCMAAGLVTDYAAFIERRRLGSFSLAGETQVHARELLELDPPYYDAYLAVGTAEYVLGSLPFFIRWFVRIGDVKGDKEQAIEHLRIVAERGKYYGPFARILLAVISLREQRPREAEQILAGLVADYPENPLLQRELARTRDLATCRESGRSNCR